MFSLRSVSFCRLAAGAVALAMVLAVSSRKALGGPPETAAAAASLPATPPGHGLDPDDMDTPLHALAVPDADPATLKRPESAARELADAIAAALPEQFAPVVGRLTSAAVEEALT